MLSDTKKFCSIALKRAAKAGVCLALGIAALSTSSASAGNTTYQYDALGRVVKVTYPDAKQICYAYDAAGNRTQVKRQATGTCTASGSVLALQASQTMLQSAEASAAQQNAAKVAQNEALTTSTTSDDTTPSL